MPPLIKIYEAFGALADQRCTLLDSGLAFVQSSDGSKTYRVESSEDGREISANDNASYWQGYIGYPAIAVLIHRGILKADPKAIEALKSIPWHALNQRFRHNYEKTLREVEERLTAQGYDPDLIRRAAQDTLEQLRALAPRRGRRLRPA